MKVAILLFLALAAATTVRKAPSCVSVNSCASHDFAISGKASPNQNITIGIKTLCDNHEVIEEILYTVSDPQNARYGEWMTWEQIERLALNPERVNNVVQFFAAHGLTTKVNRWWVDVTGPVSTFEKIFAAQFNVYTSPSTKMTLVRTLKATIPNELEATETIIGLTSPFPPTRRTSMIVSGKSDGYTDPNTLYRTYNIPTSQVTEAKATQAVFEALGQSMSSSDLATFLQTFNLPPQTPTIVGPNDGSSCANNPNNCAEASLDIQYILAVASGAPTTFWSINPNSNDPFFDWIKAQVAKGAAAPKVTSISYGGIESEQIVTDMTAFNNDLQKLAVSGITVVVSSGDDGVAGYIARNDQSQCGYNPEFPATSPYVLAVGATQGPEANMPEIACASNTGGLITSGGGFSQQFNQPSYQTSAVAAFLAQTTAVSGYNAGGRGFPDIAMLGHNYDVFIGGQEYVLSGTSCSAPVTGGILTRVNAARIKAGKSTLGFINPLVYSTAGSNMVYNLIISGNNTCCAAQSNPVCCSQGFNCWTGQNGVAWSPVTGLGSVNVANALKYWV